jgi:hypothetical protein
MSGAAKARFITYLVFAIVGFVTAMYFNGLAVMGGEDYLAAWFTTPADLVLAFDLSVVAIAAGVFMVIEARRIGMKKVWVYLLLSGVTALAFTFPLYLAMRERHLATTAK